LVVTPSFLLSFPFFRFFLLEFRYSILTWPRLFLDFVYFRSVLPLSMNYPRTFFHETTQILAAALLCNHNRGMSSAFCHCSPPPPDSHRPMREYLLTPYPEFLPVHLFPPLSHFPPPPSIEYPKRVIPLWSPTEFFDLKPGSPPPPFFIFLLFFREFHFAVPLYLQLFSMTTIRSSCRCPLYVFFCCFPAFSLIILIPILPPHLIFMILQTLRGVSLSMAFFDDPLPVFISPAFASIL